VLAVKARRLAESGLFLRSSTSMYTSPFHTLLSNSLIGASCRNAVILVSSTDFPGFDLRPPVLK